MVQKSICLIFGMLIQHQLPTASSIDKTNSPIASFFQLGLYTLILVVLDLNVYAVKHAWGWEKEK